MTCMETDSSAQAASGPSAEQPDAHAVPKKRDPGDKSAEGTAPSTQAGSPVSPDSLPPAPVPLTAAYGRWLAQEILRTTLEVAGC
jgi:hypothetical protein